MTTTVALIGLTGVVVSAIVGPIVVARTTRRRLRNMSDALDEKLGTPNGHGDIATMLSTILHQQGLLLDGQTGQDVRLATIDHRLARGDERMADLGARLSVQGDRIDGLAARVDGIERSCSALPAIEAATEAIAHHTDTDRRHDDPGGDHDPHR